jgi:hypothetical protein
MGSESTVVVPFCSQLEAGHQEQVLALIRLQRSQSSGAAAQSTYESHLDHHLVGKSFQPHLDSIASGGMVWAGTAVLPFTCAITCNHYKDAQHTEGF